jgi:hypothetical protein
MDIDPERTTGLDIIQIGTMNVPVNTKNWYRKGTDLWAEFGDEIPFGRKNLLRQFGKGCLRSVMHHHSAKGLFALLKGSFRECVVTWPDIRKERVDGVYEMDIGVGALI